MKIFGRVPGKGPESEEDVNVTRTARLMGKAIDKATVRLFATFRETLLKKPITYVVPAVWGAAIDEELDSTQKEIHYQISPVLDRIFNCIGLKNMNPTQQFIFEFQVRGLIVSKIAFMIEAFKNHYMDKTISRIVS